MRENETIKAPREFVPYHDGLWEATIWDVLHKWVREQPDQECLVSPAQGIRWSWKQLDEISDLAARGMMAMGIEKDDKVAIWATNVVEWFVTALASSKIGAVLVTVNTNYKQYELEYLLRQSDTKMLVMIDRCKDSDYVSHINAVVPGLGDMTPGEIDCEGLPFLKSVVYIGKKEDTPEGFIHFDELYKMSETVRVEELAAVKSTLSPHDVCNMQYTSGTTGFPKGVMLTHYNLVNNGGGIGDCMKLTPDDRLLIVVPMFHCFGFVLALMACLTHGSTMVIVDLFNPVTVMQTVQDERCTALHGVPTMFIAQLEHPDFYKYDFSSLRTGIMAGSPCPIQIMKRVIEEMNMRDITITYGLTEASPGMTMSTTGDPIEKRVATVGKRLPHVEVKIVDPETMEELPYGTPGEIVTRGYHVMRGYYKMQEATRAAITEDGWLRSGDIGIETEDGYFKVTGRLKDMIIRGGENIYPREIEEFLYTNEKVQDVQVVGMPDKKYGEEVMAFIILKPGVQGEEQEMIDFVKNGLSRFKAPHYVRFIDEFPMTASGKIQKYKLREMGIGMLGLEDAAKIETA
ncbi:MAG: AMP-binding protein [Christensenellales bacterium]